MRKDSGAVPRRQGRSAPSPVRHTRYAQLIMIFGMGFVVGALTQSWSSGTVAGLLSGIIGIVLVCIGYALKLRAATSREQ